MISSKWTQTLAVVLSLVVTAVNSMAQNPTAVGEDYFKDKLFPIMKTAQCDLCHNDNGVASATAIDFPSASASDAQITAFGLQLMDMVDRKQPDQSLLLRKPTNREEHTGGVRIKPDSDEEKVLRRWVEYLARLDDDQVRAARAKIAEAQKWKLEPLTIRRLTHSQYNRTVHDLLRDQSEPANRFPKEDYIHGFKNQLEGQGISPIQSEAYGEAAERLAKGAFRNGDSLGLLPKQPRGPDDRDAAKAFVSQFGLKTFRRPLTPREESIYVDLLIRNGTRDRDFFSGAKVVVEAMLQSPNFLFRIERGNDSDFRPYEIASRLSYLLWDTMPDDELFQAAKNGELNTPAQIEQRARKMMADPRAQVSFDEFLSQWMRFDNVLGATKDRRRYREFNSELAGAMVEETRQLFHHLVSNDRNFMEFYSANYTFLNGSLAQLYGIPAPAEDFARVEYPEDSGRSGILGHGTFLVQTSKPAETSPTARGLFVRNHIFGQDVAPPPPGVNTVLPELTEDKPLTNRQRLEIHLNSEACSGCHRLIDPIGLGFEQYDAIGSFQKKMVLRFGGRDNPSSKEIDVDTTAYVQGVENSSFSSPKELGKLIAENETCQRNIVKQYFRYAFGREETPADQPILEDAFRRFRDSQFRFREMVMAFVMSKLFLQTES